MNPKAKSLLKGLADLNLIRIKKDKPELQKILSELRVNERDVPSLEEIAKEVEAVRQARYEK